MLNVLNLNFIFFGAIQRINIIYIGMDINLSVRNFFLLKQQQ